MGNIQILNLSDCHILIRKMSGVIITLRLIKRVEIVMLLFNLKPLNLYYIYIRIR